MATVMITGAGRGIGLELARVFAQEGNRVIAGVRDLARAPDLATPVQLDVSDERSVAELTERLADVPIDVLVNNAGVIGPDRQSGHDMDYPGFLITLEVNTLGPLRVTQALLPNLRLVNGARVAIVTSRMGSLSYAKSDRIAYRASKAAANKVTQCLATDLAAEGIAVAAIHPGWVRSDMGGAHADIDVTTSASGLKAVIDQLDAKRTGRFWNYDGTELPW